MDIVGYDILEDGGLRYAWKDARFKKCIESAAFINRSKGKLEDICGYTTSVSSGCILRTHKGISVHFAELEMYCLSVDY